MLLAPRSFPVRTMSLPRFSVHNPVIVNLLMVIILVTGGLCGLGMVREMFPESRPEKLLISTPYPGVSPAEIEKALTIRIEEAVRDVQGIEKIDSTASDGISFTVLTLVSGTRDVDRVLQEVKAEIDAIPDLPPDAEKTTIRKMEPKLPVISVALFGPGEEAARKQAARQLRDDLLLLPGVSDVEMNGQRDDEISVEVRPEKLLQYDITFEEVAAAVREANLDVTGGRIDGARSTVSIRTLGEEQLGERLNRILLRSLPDGRSLFLKDVALVRDDFVDVDQQGFFNSEPCINCVVYQARGQDAIRISQLVKAYVKGKQNAAFDPFGISAAHEQPWYWKPFSLIWAHGSRFVNAALGQPDPDEWYQRSRERPFDHRFQVALHTDIARFIEGRIDMMVDNGLQGLFMILLALMLFLDRRVAFWAAVGLPVTFLGAFMIMSIMGVTLNLVSLMALIIVMSIDVDEAIVMGENIYRHMEEGLPPKEAAIKGSEEVLWPIITMTGTTIGAFFPLLFIKGQLGDFMKELPLVCIAAMSMSMVEALIMLPSHLGHVRPIKRFLRRPDSTEPASEAPAPDATTSRPVLFPKLRAWKQQLADVRTAFFDWLIDDIYDRFIRLSLRWRYVTLATAISTLFLAFGLVAGGIVPFVPSPDMDSETLVGDLEMPIGSPSDRTRDRLKELSDYAKSLPEVVNVQSYVGIQVDIAGSGAVGAKFGGHLGQLVIELTEGEKRDRTSEMVLTDLRLKGEQLSGINSLAWTSLNGGPAGRSVEVQLAGNDLEETASAAEAVKQQLTTYQGVFDIDDDLDLNQREMQLRLRESARATGISVASLGQEVRGAFYGREARRITRNRESVKIMVRYPEVYRDDLFSLESMWIPTPGGPERRGWVPVHDVAELTESTALASIRRSDQRRAVMVYADVNQSEANDSEVVAALELWMQTELAKTHPGVRAEMLGKTLENRKFMNSMMWAFPCSLAIIYVLLAALFRSYTQPIVVMIAVPFGVQGAIIGHWIMGYEMTIMTAIGLVALNGIVDNDSLVLVDFINTRIRAGLSTLEASVAGSKLRMRAIVLNTVTAVVGMSPLMFETSFQARFLIPMAITLAWGLIFATVLTLVVVPSINMVFLDVRHLFGIRRDVSE